MRLCTDCLHVDDRKIDHCPACGGKEFAHATRRGDVVGVPAGAGMPCQHCYEVDRDLELRYYRRTLGMLISARVWGEAGYFCGPCRRKRFASNMGFTLLLGWWGIFSFWFYNPYAILVNLWALFAAPFGAHTFDAMNVHEIRSDAAEHAERQQRLADVYMRMPGWLESLKDEEVDLILARRDYYSDLGVAVGATHVEIKSAYRERLKVVHPDRGASGSHEQTVAINDAYRVLGDERLRHAFDNREELLTFLHDVDSAQAERDDTDVEPNWGCRLCMAGFVDFDEAADHIEHSHPNVDLSDALVELVSDDESDEADVSRWRCKACGDTFDMYEDALQHAENAHPERTVIDLRTAVERI